MNKQQATIIDFIDFKTRKVLCAETVLSKGKVPLIPLLFVKSDNFEGLITESAYHDLTLEMSSGDFGSHSKERRWFTKSQFKSLQAKGQITFSL